jgi:acyl-CoA thioester hydrolase
MPDARTPLRFSAPYRVRFDEADATGALRASSHLRFMQDVAWQHSTSAGFDMAWYAARERFWLVRSLELTVAVPIPYGISVEVTTEVVAMRRFWARRVSEFRLPEGGGVAATGTIDWVITDPEGRPARVPEEMARAFPAAAPTDGLRRLDLPDGPPPGVESCTTQVRRTEIDPMRHMNNAAYLDHMEEAVEAAGGADLLERPGRRYRLEYLRAAQPEGAVTGLAWETGRGWAYHLADEEGCLLFRGIVEPAE